MSGRVRIAIVVSHPIQHFCPQYASFAKHSGVEVKVFFGSTLGYKKYIDPNFKKEISWNNLRLEEFAHVFLNGDQMLPSDNKLDAPSLDNELTAYQPNILIVYGYFQPMQRRAWRWARKNKVLLAFISDSERRQKRNPLKELIKYPLLRWYYSHIDIFLTVGDANEAYYRFYRVRRNKMVRMHFAIDLPLYQKSFENRDRLRKEVRTRYGIQDGELTLSVVGKLVNWKKQDDIIEAIKMLESRGIYVHLFMLGSGDMMEEWKQKAIVLKHSKVHFAGFVNPDELPGYYAASDIYVHPAAIEPHSLAISEAIFMGRPVIVSDRTGSYGPDDDVQEGRNGYVFPCGNIERLAELIASLKQDSALQKKFGEYSHNIAVEFQQRAHFTCLNKLINRWPA